MRFQKIPTRPKVRLRRPRIRIRWRKSSSWWAVGVAVAFFATLFAFHIILMWHAESIIRSALDSRVQQATEGYYSSGFDHIEVNYTRKDFIIHNLHIYADSTRLVDNAGKKIDPAQVYDILIPQLRIEGINLRKAYLDKALIIDRLVLDRPDINLYFNLDLPPTVTDAIKQDIDERLSSFFTSIQAKSLLVREGKVDLRAQKNGQQSRIKSILQLEADKLLVLTNKPEEDSDWLLVDRFVVQAGPTAGHVADETYMLRLKNITASSSDSSLYIQGFQLLPTDKVANLLSQKPDLDRIYTITVPQLYSYGIDFSQLYNKQIFTAAELTVFAPVMDLFDAKPRAAGEKENFTPEDLYPAIEKILHRVTIDQVFVRHGKTAVRNKADRLVTKFKATIREASVFNFELDSAAHIRNDKLFFADSVRLSIIDYQLRLSDNLHLLLADGLEVNSNTQSAHATNLSIVPDSMAYLRRNKPVLYHATVPSVDISGIDLLQLYNGNKLFIDSLSVENPDIQYTQQSKKEKTEAKQQKTFQQQDLYGLISDYLFQLSIHRLSIDGGVVGVNRTIQDSVEVFNTNIRHAYLWNLMIDSTSAFYLNKLFYADNFDVEITDYMHKMPDGLHTVNVASISVSTLKDRIAIAGISISNLPGYTYPFRELQRIENNTLLNIEVPFLELNGVDILQSYLSKKLVVQEVVLPNPKVHFAGRVEKKGSQSQGIVHSRVLYGLMENFIEEVNVKTLRLSDAEIFTAFYTPNGTLELNTPSASVAIDNFRFDGYTSRNPKQLFFADAVSVSAENFVADLPDERYQLQAAMVEASTADQQISAIDVQLNHADQALNEASLALEGKKGIVSFTFPAVKISGLDFDKAYYQEHLHIDSIVAAAPKLTYFQLPGKSKNNKKAKSIIPKLSLYESISPFLQHLSVGLVKLEQGTITTETRFNGEKQQSHILDNISVSVSDFLVDSSTVTDVKRFFYAEDIQVHIGEYRWLLPDKVHQITAGNLDLSTRNNLIRASDVKLGPVPGISSSAINTAFRYQITVPEVVLVGIAFDDIFEKEEFKLTRLDVLNPDIEIRKFQTGQSLKVKDPRSLPELLSAGLNLMQIESAVVSGASLKYIQYGQDKPVEVSFPEVEAKVTNFSITPATVASGAKPFFSDNLEVKLIDWKRLMPDSIHWVEAGNINFSAKDSLVIAQNLQVYPDAQKLDITDQDLIYAKVPTIRLEGFNYAKLTKDTFLLEQLWVLSPTIHLLKATTQANAPIAVESKAAKSNMLDLIKMDSIRLTDGTVIFQKNSADDTSRFELNKIYVNAAGFHYDSLQQFNQERILYTDNLEAGMKNYRAFTNGGFYEIEAKEIGISTGKQQLWADSLRITPALDKDAFAVAKGYETDQFILRNRRLVLDSLNLRKLFHDNTLEANKLHLDGFNMYIYRDKRQPFPDKKRSLMPQTLLRDSKMDIMIRETELTNGYLAYAERVKGAPEEGFIDLTNLYLHADTISNYPTVLNSGYVTTLSTNFDLMGTGHLQAYFEIPMGDTTNQHVYYGSLDQMALADFNPILEKTSFISIRSGQLDRINFKVIADAEVAEGSMEFVYDDLRVALVNKKTGKPGGLFRRIASSVANVFVHSSNTLDNKDNSIRSGEIEVKRDEKRSIVNYWIKTLLGGFKSSIGI